jgi:hypothetical protein
MASEHSIAGPGRVSHRYSAPTVRLVRPVCHPDRIAVSKIDSFIKGGTFFLDFTRPIQLHRRFGRIDFHVGLVVGLMVPVIHEREARGRHLISVYSGDPHFEDLCSLWKAYYPAEQLAPDAEADRLRCSADFAAQFPNDH